MLRDRGRIKWTSMMLPEHVKLLRDWAEEDKQEQKKELDEQELEEMNQLLEEAIQSNHLLSFTYFENHRYKTVTGRVHKVDFYQKILFVKGEKEEIVQISLSQLDHVEWV